MNFIEAHQIVNQYIDAVARIPKGKLLSPVSKLPFYGPGWKTKLVNASKLYVSYVLLWRTWSQEQTENYLDLLAQMDVFFASDNEANAVNDAKATLDKHKNSNALLKRINAEKIDAANKIMQRYINDRGDQFEDGRRRKEEVIKVFNQMYYYKINTFDVRKNNGEDLLLLIDEYCQEAYRVAGIEFGEDDGFYFFPFDKMCEFLSNPSLRQYYEKYEGYLRMYA